jgi:hypothetical protein
LAGSGHIGGAEIRHGREGTLGDASNVALTLPNGAQAIAPPANSTGIGPNTTLSWGLTDGGATTGTSRVEVECSNPHRLLTIHTTDSSLKLPDLAALAWVPEKGARCS